MYESFVMRVCAEIVCVVCFFFLIGLCVWGKAVCTSLTAGSIGITSISLSVHNMKNDLKYLCCIYVYSCLNFD